MSARVLDPRNQDRMKRRRAGVVHTHWDNLWTKWSGDQRWWESLRTGKDSSRKLKISAREAWSKTFGGLWKYPHEGRRNKKSEHNERKGEAQTLESCVGKSDENTYSG